MIEFIYWFGLLHLAAYALIGFAFAALFTFEFVFNRFVKRLGIERDLLRMYRRYLDEKHGRFGA